MDNEKKIYVYADFLSYPYRHLDEEIIKVSPSLLKLATMYGLVEMLLYYLELLLEIML